MGLLFIASLTMYGVLLQMKLTWQWITRAPTDVRGLLSIMTMPNKISGNRRSIDVRNRVVEDVRRLVRSQKEPHRDFVNCWSKLCLLMPCCWGFKSFATTTLIHETAVLTWELFGFQVQLPEQIIRIKQETDCYSLQLFLNKNITCRMRFSQV